MRNKLRLPSWIPTALIAIGIYLLVTWASSSGKITTYWYSVIQLAALTAVSALGLNLIYGFNGQFSLGHVGFYAIGAYGSALVTKDLVSTWSGSPVGGLSWMIAGQLGVVATLFLIGWLGLGRIRKRILLGLVDVLKGHEAKVIAALVVIALGVLGVGVGVGVTMGLHRVLLAVLEAFIAALPQKAAEDAIFVLALVNGGTMAALIAYLVGLPLLRLSSDYFGIATLGFAIMVYTALQNSDLIIATMKGARGMVAIPRWTTWGWAFGVLAVTIILLRNLIWSSYGRGIMAVREDEIATKAVGIDVAQMKAVAFALGGFLAGVAGGLYAHLYGFLHPSTFNFIKGFDPLIIIVFGGLGSMTGTIMASALFSLVIEGLRVLLPQGFEDWRFVVYPVLLLVVMLLRQKGLLGTTEWGWLRAPLPPERGVAPPLGPMAGTAKPGEETQHA
ncbi:MAG: branched-chain amino acid ABC transporter permease [Anaerolineae bacterium]